MYPVSIGGVGRGGEIDWTESNLAKETSSLYSVMGCGASTPDDGGGETYAGTDSNAYTIGMPSIHSVGSACAVDVRATDIFKF